jgi:tricorn protease interacting factor F2/3
MTDPITPFEYRLNIAPDLVRFTFAGKMILSANAEKPVQAIVLDCVELAIWQCQVSFSDGDGESYDCRFEQDPARQRLTVHLPETVTGRLELTIEYAGKINDRMAGFYRSRIDVENAPDFIAVTQFQESDARRAFPCLDHPARKAVFHLEMIIEKDLTAISNMDIEKATDLPDGRRRILFQPTPKMSTYLLFFGVGPFEIHSDELDPRVRAVSLPGTGDQTVFGREFGRKALAYGENYYAVDYPLTKMDLIAVPDFAFGAMENWGAITFRENLLLDVPGVTSREARVRICEVIAHEIAHQWFGNLVTPEDWKYLWLNESFATYFGYGMVDHYYPEWEIWHQFVQGQTETAFARDALHETFAIEMPGGAQVAITTSTAPIIYSKGGSILRQLEAWIGADHFKAGLRRYLTNFAYESAASHHLWESLGAASGMPVTEMMRNWVTQPGFPVIGAKSRDNRLRLTQQRFTYLPNEAAQTWLVPLTITTYNSQGASANQTILCDQREIEIDLPADTTCYLINPGHSGFFHVRYDDGDNLARLGAMTKTGQLSPLDRWGLQNDLYALVKAGQTPMTAFIDLAANFTDERAYLPLASLDGHLFEACLVLKGQVRKRADRTAENMMQRVIEAIGWLPSPEESQTTAMLRDQLLLHGALLGFESILGFLTDQFAHHLEGGHIPPDIFKSVVTAGAVSGDRQTLDAIIARFEASQVEHERMTLAWALGAFSQWRVLEKALDYALEKVPDRLRFIPLVLAAGNPAATDNLWPWFTANFARMGNMHPLLFERVVASFVPVPGLLDPDATRAFCHGCLKENPRLKDVLALSLERLEINARFRQREG